MKYLLVIKGDITTAAKECQARDIHWYSMERNDNWDMTFVKTNEINPHYFLSGASTTFNNWMCEADRPYPNGSLLFWNEVV